MARHKRIKPDEFAQGCLILIVIITFIFALNWYNSLNSISQSFFWITIFVVAYYSYRFYQKKKSEKKAKYLAILQAIKISNIDNMSGYEFENYLSKILTYRGYSIQQTSFSKDYGVDLIAKKGDNSFAIQVKCYSNKVSRAAVSDAVGGMKYYNCNHSMVITNNYFHKSARLIAEANNCILIDRDELIKWIVEFQKYKV